MAGKTFQDRELAAQVRSLTLEKIKVILTRAVVEMNAQDKSLHDEILVKLAGTILPRLNEISGMDGEPIVVTIVQYAKPKKDSNSETKTNGKSDNPA